MISIIQAFKRVLSTINALTFPAYYEPGKGYRSKKMQVINKDHTQCRLLFEYTGDFDSLINSGVNIQSVFGGDCYSAIISHQKLAQLQKSERKLRIISLY